jgi:hypothetical protein
MGACPSALCLSIYRIAPNGVALAYQELCGIIDKFDLQSPTLSGSLVSASHTIYMIYC